MRIKSEIGWGLMLLVNIFFLRVGAEAEELEQGFRGVAHSAKPWVYYWWLNGHVDEPTIIRDLEAMERVGVGGFLVFDARGYWDDTSHLVLPPPKMDFMGPQWRQMLRLALQKADSLGLEVSVNLSSCAGSLKGPWKVGDDAPKKLVWETLEVQGPQRLTYEWKKPEGQPFREVAVLGLLVSRTSAQPMEPAPGVKRPEGGQEAGVETSPRIAVKVVDLTQQVDAQGRLCWEVEPGQWTLVRFGYVAMEGRDYDVDILDPKAVEAHFERMGKAILEDAGPLAGKTLTHFYTVSWEGALPTWTREFAKEFEARRGYKIRPWLPVLAGFLVRTREESDRFLRDYHKTLAECFQDNYYGKLQELCHQHGLKWHAESGGPWNRNLPVFAQADQLAFLARTDMPQGEFWWGGVQAVRHRGFNRSAAMTAHIYGKPLAAAEAFTHMVHHWSAYPATLKPRADVAFCEGINHLIWHTFTASPVEFGRPGIEYFAGTHINPNVTWFPQAAPFFTYLARCQWMLRQGHLVADVCVYIGDKPYIGWSSSSQKLHGGGGTNSFNQNTPWSARATLKLPKGYTYDLVNTEVLLSRMRVQDGDLVLPDGMGYRALVVDWEEDVAEPTVLEKLVTLAKAGATVVLGQRRAERAPGLRDYPRCDQQVQQRAEELDKIAMTGKSTEESLQTKGIPPDFEGPWNYIHRRTSEADIYFLVGEGTAPCTFRVKGKQAELWNPVSGQIVEAPDWHWTDDGRTVVSVSLPENGSIFVVFRKPGQPPRPPAPPKPPVETIPLTGPWQVSFEPDLGAPDSVTFDRLIPWNEHPHEGIKFFSGTAIYRKSFELTAEQSSRGVRLQLGQVYCTAQVRLNGKPLAILWTAPWSVDATPAIRPGNNALEIAVTNTWVNRLIGDAALPPEKRITKTNVALRPGKRTPSFRLYQGFASEDPLMPSGLLGPVQLDFFEGTPSR